MNNLKRRLINLRLIFMTSGYKKAEYLKKQSVFFRQGDNCYFQPNKFGTEPHLIILHNNVFIASNVSFITHDVVSMMINNVLKSDLSVRVGTIEIYDNVFIGANSTLLYNVKIGPNSIVAAGSVVNKDIPANVIVAGVPARVVGKFDDYVNKLQKFNLEVPWAERHLSSKEIVNIQKRYFWGA